MERLVVDGYNVIHGWPSLRRLLATSLEQARDVLVGRLAVYHQVRGADVTVVFDAHLSGSLRTGRETRDGVTVVFTRARVTADHEIERLAYGEARAGRSLLVATSDRFHRDMLRGMGAAVIDARELELRVQDAERELRQTLRRHYT